VRIRLWWRTGYSGGKVSCLSGQENLRRLRIQSLSCRDGRKLREAFAAPLRLVCSDSRIDAQRISAAISRRASKVRFDAGHDIPGLSGRESSQF